MNIALTKEMEALIQRRVSTGMYSNASEVVRDALRHLETSDPYSELRNIIDARIEEAEGHALSEVSIDDIVAAAKKGKRDRV